MGEFSYPDIKGLYQDIKELIKKGMALEAQEKVMEMREAALAYREENLALKERVRDLEASAQIEASLNWDGVVYWRGGEDEKEGPYCPRCWDAEKKLLRLQHVPGGDSIRRHWRCYECKNNYFP